MAGIYFHIPFCRKACTYCDFHFSTGTATRAEMPEALITELLQRRTYLPAETEISTIYFGGGTPSVFTPEELNKLISACKEHFNVHPTAEITLEANPEDLSLEYLTALKAIGINRLSIGTQSFLEKDLLFSNRAHSPQQAVDSVLFAREAGFENISLDLIFGFPDQTLESWLENVDRMIALNPEHISCYSLTVEEKTALHHQIKKGSTVLPPDERLTEFFLKGSERLEAAGYSHYEISNFAKEGFRSKHNGNYWKSKSYLGIGPSAHSYNGVSRRWNVANNPKYVAGVQKGDGYFEEEQLSEIDIFNEQLMTRLRTSEGLQWDDVPIRFREELHRTQKNQPEDWFLVDDSALRMSKSGWLLLDHFLVEAMV